MDYQQILQEQMKETLDADAFDALTKQVAEYSGGMAEDFTLDSIVASALNGEALFDSQELIENLKSLFLMRSAVCFARRADSDGLYCHRTAAEPGNLVRKKISVQHRTACLHDGDHRHCSQQLSPDLYLESGHRFDDGQYDGAGHAGAAGDFDRDRINRLGNDPASDDAGCGDRLRGSDQDDHSAGAVRLDHAQSDQPSDRKKLCQSAFQVDPQCGVDCDRIDSCNPYQAFSVQGLLTDTSDGLLINAARYSLSTFIPIVGGFTADTVELFLRCMRSIKGIVGVLFILMLVLLTLVPLLKMLACALIYKLTAAVTEPVTDSKIPAGLSDMGNCLISMTAIVFFTALLFIIFISIINGIGGG